LPPPSDTSTLSLHDALPILAEGGSTITQQLAKENFVGDEPTVIRKAKELLYAVALEHRFTKDQLLERYLNQVYFGSQAYGVAAADRKSTRLNSSHVAISYAV